MTPASIQFTAKFNNRHDWRVALNDAAAFIWGLYADRWEFRDGSSIVAKRNSSIWQPGVHEEWLRDEEVVSAARADGTFTSSLHPSEFKWCYPKQ